jgi:cyclopropane fatty-acyl-phospholipid synthase-like methyltransferase
MENIKLITDFPIAYESPDHIMPWGTKNDNSTNHDFIEETLEFFKQNHELNTIKFLDLGCSGGQLVVDFYEKGNLSVGLEGSDYSVKHQRANWPKYHNDILFTCDVTKPYSLYKDENKIHFNFITAWEVIEHIHPKDLKNFFQYISDNLEENGTFVGSVSTKEDVIEGHVLHQSVFSEDVWYDKLMNKIIPGTGLSMYQYPFSNAVREDWGSFNICLKKENNV